MYICMLICIYIYIICVYMYVYICLFVCMYMYVCIYIYIYMYLCNLQSNTPPAKLANIQFSFHELRNWSNAFHLLLYSSKENGKNSSSNQSWHTTAYVYMYVCNLQLSIPPTEHALVNSMKQTNKQINNKQINKQTNKKTNNQSNQSNKQINKQSIKQTKQA